LLEKGMLLVVLLYVLFSNVGMNYYYCYKNELEVMLFVNPVVVPVLKMLLVVVDCEFVNKLLVFDCSGLILLILAVLVLLLNMLPVLLVVKLFEKMLDALFPVLIVLLVLFPAKMLEVVVLVVLFGLPILF